MIGLPIFLFGYLWIVGLSLLWYLRTRKAAKEDLPLPTVSYRWSRIRNNTFAACAIIWLVCMFAGLALEVLGGMPVKFLLLVVLPLLALGAGLWLRRQIDTIRRTRIGNIALTVAVIAIMEVVVIGLTVMVISRYPTPPPGTLGDRPALTLAAFGITAEPEFDSVDVRGSVLVPVHYSHWESNRQGNVST
jgi:amino acid transporter